MIVNFTLVWIAGGATCWNRETTSQFNTPPIIFEAEPQLDQLIAAVNRTDTVKKLQSTNAKVEMLDASMGVPRLDATLAIDRPNRFSIKANLPVIMGEALDLGSNDQVFWMRYPEGLQKTLLFARHDEFQNNLLNSPLPIDPRWLVDAMGLVHLDATTVTEGPIVRGDGTLEVRTAMPTPSGTFHRILLIDAAGGFVRSQYVYGPTGKLVARADGSDHNYYAEAQVVLPHKVQLQIELQGAPPLSLQVEVGGYVLNRMLGNESLFFEMPSQGNHQVIDLSRVGPFNGPTTIPPPVPQNYESQSMAPAQGAEVEPVQDYVRSANYGPSLRGQQLR